jgi:hypothetical protein
MNGALNTYVHIRIFFFVQVVFKRSGVTGPSNSTAVTQIHSSTSLLTVVLKKHPHQLRPTSIRCHLVQKVN